MFTETRLFFHRYNFHASVELKLESELTTATRVRRFLCPQVVMHVLCARSETSFGIIYSESMEGPRETKEVGRDEGAQLPARIGVGVW